MTRASSIESKRILIQVIVQVFTAHSALVRPDQPALQQGSHPVNVGQQLGGRLARTGQKVVLVPIAKRLQADVPFPAVGVDRAVGLDSLLDEAVQLLLVRSADALHTDPSYPRAVFLGGDGYQCFFLRLPSAQSLFCAPHIGLVDLHATAEPFSAGPHHRAPQLVQQRPGGTVASQTQDALQSQCARPVFLAGHPPHGPKPGAQRQARVLENRARRHRSLIIALPTPQQAPPAGPSSPPSTAGTHKTLWPAQLHQILATRLLSGKTPLKLLQRPRVVLHSPACYMLGSRESSAYPDLIIASFVLFTLLARLMRDNFYGIVLVVATAANIAGAVDSLFGPGVISVIDDPTPVVEAGAATQANPSLMIYLVLDAYMGPAGFPAELPGSERVRRSIEDTFLKYGFTLYSNAFSHYAWTNLSMRSLLNLTLLDRVPDPDAEEQYRLFSHFKNLGWALSVYRFRSASKFWVAPSADRQVVYNEFLLGGIRDLPISWTDRLQLLSKMHMNRSRWILLVMKNVYTPWVNVHGLQWSRPSRLR